MQLLMGGAAFSPFGEYLPTPLYEIVLTPFTIVGTKRPAAFFTSFSFSLKTISVSRFWLRDL